MKKIASLIMTAALASSAFAGTPSGGKIVAPPAPTCDWFAPGLKVGANVSGIVFDKGGDGAMGGGILAEYFFCENFGIEGSYNVFGTDGTHHQFDFNLIARYPMKSKCWAPYMLVGGGFGVNGDTVGNWQLGAGVEAHLKGNMGVFADGSYHWADAEEDFTVIRLGLKFRL